MDRDLRRVEYTDKGIERVKHKEMKDMPRRDARTHTRKHTHTLEHNFSVQLITVYALVKSKSAVEKGSMCNKKCKDYVQTDDLCAD